MPEFEVSLKLVKGAVNSAEEVQERSGLKVLTMDFNFPEGTSRDTSILSLLIKYGNQVLDHMNLESIELRNLNGQKVDAVSG